MEVVIIDQRNVISSNPCNLVSALGLCGLLGKPLLCTTIICMCMCKCRHMAGVIGQFMQWRHMASLVGKGLNVKYMYNIWPGPRKCISSFRWPGLKKCVLNFGRPGSKECVVNFGRPGSRKCVVNFGWPGSRKYVVSFGWPWSRKCSKNLNNLHILANYCSVCKKLLHWSYNILLGHMQKVTHLLGEHMHATV